MRVIILSAFLGLFLSLNFQLFAQSTLPGRLQIDIRHTEIHNLDFRYRSNGIGFEYMLLDKAKWQLGARFGALYRLRTDLPKNFHSRWFSLDLVAYRRLGDNWWWGFGLGASTQLMPNKVWYKAISYYELTRYSWPYTILSLKRDFAKDRFFVQLQTRIIPYPDIAVLREGHADLSIGVRLNCSSGKLRR
ncbi:MAG: hypothetical protein AAF927_29245 [Bacteroidota bacterium]